MAMPEDKSWKVVDSEYLHRRPWLTVRRDSLQLPNGNLIPEYYVLEYPDWVNVIAITKEGMFVLIRQYRHGIGRTSFELCAGVRDDTDPTPLAAAQRELEEETGYGNGTWEEFIVISANPSTNSNLTYCYLATGVEPVAPPHPEDSEDITVHLLTYDEVKELLHSGQILQALHAAPLWKYVAER